LVKTAAISSKDRIHDTQPSLSPSTPALSLDRSASGLTPSFSPRYNPEEAISYSHNKGEVFGGGHMKHSVKAVAIGLLTDQGGL